MKKTILTGLAMFAVIVTATAQEGFAVKAGLNNVSISVDTNGFFDASDSELGFFIGGSYNFEAGDNFDIEPSLLLSIVDDLTSLYIPVMAKYKISDQFNIQAGPQINYLLEDIPDGELGLDLGFGAGYQIDSNWFVEARYAFQLTRGGDFGDVVDINTLTIGGGYRFN
ncbi:outer membrane beta-barrel protein [Allomuricauda sp. d1]|uniref:outer membrane beta-barrel protein n=1 Tax=Allomuricauda sp. d1 TaxID=3136725 RepID=UPI0031DAD2FD